MSSLCCLSWQASELDNIVSFFEGQRISEQPLQEPTALAARNPQQEEASGRPSAFAAAAATSAPAPLPAADTDTTCHNLQVNEVSARCLTGSPLPGSLRLF